MDAASEAEQRCPRGHGPTLTKGDLLAPDIARCSHCGAVYRDQTLTNLAARMVELEREADRMTTMASNGLERVAALERENYILRGGDEYSGGIKMPFSDRKQVGQLSRKLKALREDYDRLRWQVEHQEGGIGDAEIRALVAERDELRQTVEDIEQRKSELFEGHEDDYRRIVALERERERFIELTTVGGDWDPAQIIFGRKRIAALEDAITVFIAGHQYLSCCHPKTYQPLRDLVSERKNTRKG